MLRIIAAYVLAGLLVYLSGSFIAWDLVWFGDMASLTRFGFFFLTAMIGTVMAAFITLEG